MFVFVFLLLQNFGDVTSVMLSFVSVCFDMSKVLGLGVVRFLLFFL